MESNPRRALTQNLNTCALITNARLGNSASNVASNREQPHGYYFLRGLIGSLAGSLAIMVIVCIAAWIVIRTGSGHSI